MAKLVYMAKPVYKVPASELNKPIFKWRYSQEVKAIYGRNSLPKDFQSNGFITEHDLINDWMKLAALAFKGKFRESSTPCWVGHIEQFGLLMLEIARLSDTRGKNATGYHLFIDQLLIEREECTYGFWQPNGSEEREWYRAWFSMIGHPDFQRIEAGDGIHSEKFMTKKMSLTIAINTLLARGALN